MEQDYLDFDGLITFLDQKGYKWNTRRTTDLLLEAITDSKLTPVFFYRGEIIVTYAKFVGINEWEEVKKDTCRLQGYFSANAYDLVDLYQDYFTCVPNVLTFNGQHVRPYKIFGNPVPIVTDHQKRTEGIETCFLHLSCGSFIDGHSRTVSEFLYPMEQLDSMFNENYRDPLAIRLEEDMNKTLTQDGFNDSEIERLREQLIVAYDTINELNNFKKISQDQINHLDSQLKQATDEANMLRQQANAPDDTSTLEAILDESHEHHAPDLKHSIQLWIDLYINGGIKSDSHSNKAGQWISKNTNYAENAKTSTDRIKEISSPFKYWSPHRKKEV